MYLFIAPRLFFLKLDLGCGLLDNLRHLLLPLLLSTVVVLISFAGDERLIAL